MPGLNCSFRIEEEVQEVDNLIDTFESDDADTDESDSSFDEEIPAIGSLLANRDVFHFIPGDSSEDDESIDEGSDDKSEQSGKENSNVPCYHHNGDFIQRELSKMNAEQSELAQNLIAAVLHEGAMGRLTSDTILTDLSEEIDSPSTSNEH